MEIAVAKLFIIDKLHEITFFEPAENAETNENCVWNREVVEKSN